MQNVEKDTPATCSISTLDCKHVSTVTEINTTTHKNKQKNKTAITVHVNTDELWSANRITFRCQLAASTEVIYNGL